MIDGGGAEEMARWVKCLPRKHEFRVQIPSTDVNARLVWPTWCGICGASWLAELTKLASSQRRDLSLIYKIESYYGRHPLSAYVCHTHAYAGEML